MYRLPPADPAPCRTSAIRLEIHYLIVISDIYKKTKLKNIKNSWNGNTSSARPCPKKSSHETSELPYCVLSYSNWNLSKYNQFFRPGYKKLLIDPGLTWDHFFGQLSKSIAVFHKWLLTQMTSGFLLRDLLSTNIHNTLSFFLKKQTLQKVTSNEKNPRAVQE